jgi:hypothetical protein
MVHNSFEAWVRAEVLPLQKKNPTWKRLDGQPAGGNRAAAGRFWYAARVWTVHADTRFEPVLRAYEAVASGAVPDPFVVVPAKSGDCLELRPELRVPKQPKYFYVYG